MREVGQVDRAAGYLTSAPDRHVARLARNVTCGRLRELAPAADAAEAVLIWAEDAARRLLGRERPASAPELLQRVALGDAALRFTLSGPVDRCALLLQVVEAGHDGDRCRSVPRAAPERGSSASSPTRKHEVYAKHCEP